MREMDHLNSTFYNSMDDLVQIDDSSKVNISLSDALSGFAELRISALKNAAEISPRVKTTTIGPNSPAKKELYTGEETIHVPSPEPPQENLMKDRLREELRYTLKLKGIELHLQENSENLFEGLLESMILKHVDSIGKYYKRQAENLEQNMMAIKAKKLRMLKTLKSNDNSLLLEEAKLDEHKSRIIDKQTMENLNRIIEEQNQATARFASVTHCYTKICSCCNEISNILQIEPDGKAVGEKYMSAINTVMTNISLIIDLCKTGTITDKEVKQGEILFLNIDNIKIKIIEELDTIKQQNHIREQQEKEEALIRQELEKQQALEIEAKRRDEREKKQIADTVPNVVKPQFYSTKNFSYFEQLKSYLESYEANYKDLLANVNLKKYRFDCQKAVNTPVNSISSVSELHMRDKFDKLSKLLKGDTVQVLDSYVTASQHPQGLNYCTALLAKKIVRQGDLLVSSNPEAAFPLASITVALWAQFPEFGKLLEAYFHKSCPYLVPMFLPQKEGQTDKEFYLSRGYTYNDEGEVEKQDKFLKRMSGIFRLRCAIWISSTPRFINTPNPHNLKYGWQWLASFINLKPEPDISATLLFDFFTVCGSAFLKHYNKQFIKVIKLIITEYLPILSHIDEGGPKTRLEVLLQNIINTGHIPPPNGLLKPNLW